MSASSNKILISFLKNKKQLLWTVALILSFYFIYYVTININKPTQGFTSYYTASKLLMQGERVEDFYNDDWFSSKVEKYAKGIYEIYFVNPPTTSLMMLPLTPFDYKTARITWILINFFLLAFSIGFIIKEFDFTNEWKPFIIILFLLFQPLYPNFAFAQAYILIFFLLTLTWYAFNSDRQVLLGSLIGVMIILKSAGLILLIFLLTQKKWRSVIWLLVTVVIVSTVSLPWIGIDAWYAFAIKIKDAISFPTLGVTAYQTIHSYFYHFFVFNQQWNPSPVINLPVLGKLFTIVLGVTLLAAVIFYAFKQKNPEMSLSVFIIAGVVLSPVSLDYHYVVLLLPILIFIKWLRENDTKLLWILLILFYALIAARLPYTSDKITAGWLAVFAYPKLYGALGLLCLFFNQLFGVKFRNPEKYFF